MLRPINLPISLFRSCEWQTMSIAHPVLLLLLVALPTHMALPEFINVGGLFHARDAQEELVFRLAADSVSSDPKLLPGHRLVTLDARVPDDDAFAVSNTVCKLLENGVAAIIGPNSQQTSEHVQSMCDTTEIPHIETSWKIPQRRQDFLVNLYPHPEFLSKVFVDLVVAFKWTSFTIVYQEGRGLARLHRLLKLFVPRQHLHVTVRQLDPGSDYRKELRRVKRSGEKNVVLDCSIDILHDVLKQAQQVGLMSSDHYFIITTPDMHTIDLEPFQHGGTNITGVRLVNPEDIDVQMAVHKWASTLLRSGQVLNIAPETLRLETALVYDAVHLFAKALQRLDLPVVDIAKIECNSNSNWMHGASLMNFMKDGQSTHRGLSGVIHFDHEGFRSNFVLEVMELTVDGLHKIGTWNSSEGLNLTRAVEVVPIPSSDETAQNKTFLVLTAISQPYGMLRNSSVLLKGNDRFEGFGIDLIHEISLVLGFNYTFELQEDNEYGSLNQSTGEWNGMIRQLLDWKADLAITDLTITAERESAVDFTMPFMNLGISILYKKPTKEAPELFSFMSPFSLHVWYCMFAVYVGVSVMLFVMGRICPYEWTNPYPCIEEPESLENQFSLKNALWFTIGSLMQQGSEIAPVAVSTRMVAGIWWFFTLIMVSSYTANLAAFLTVESMYSPFRTAEELANQNAIKYGAKKRGSTINFFRDSSYEVYNRMYRYMMEHEDEVLTKTNEEGLDRVKNENYAFLMESSSIEYMAERHCGVVQIGGLLDNKGYGIAMRKDSPYRNALSTAVLKLQESGRLTSLKNKWWKEERGGGSCIDAKSAGGTPSPLDLKNVGGVFLVLVVGVFGAVCIAILELLWSVCHTCMKEKVSFREELMEELRFVARCHGSAKPVRKHRHHHQEEEDPANCLPLSPYTTFHNDFKRPLT